MHTLSWLVHLTGRGRLCLSFRGKGGVILGPVHGWVCVCEGCVWGGLDALCVLYHLTVWGNICPQLQRRVQRIRVSKNSLGSFFCSLERRASVPCVPNETLFWMICCLVTLILSVCTERRPHILRGIHMHYNWTSKVNFNLICCQSLRVSMIFFLISVIALLLPTPSRLLCNGSCLIAW